MTETASQDQNLQRPVEQTLLDLVEAVNIVLQKRNSERMCEQLGKCRGSHNCLEKSSERMGEQIGVVEEIPKISSQERVEAVRIIPQRRVSERMCHDVPKI